MKRKKKLNEAQPIVSLYSHQMEEAVINIFRKEGIP